MVSEMWGFRVNNLLDHAVKRLIVSVEEERKRIIYCFIFYFSCDHENNVQCRLTPPPCQVIPVLDNTANMESCYKVF